MSGQWYMPLDPDCDEANEALSAIWDDPMTAYSGIGSEIAEGFERRHRSSCERCQEYGAANIEACWA